MIESASGWFLEAEFLFDWIEERAVFCFVPTAVISAEPGEWAVTFAFACFSATFGRHYHG